MSHPDDRSDKVIWIWALNIVLVVVLVVVAVNKFSTR
jgi:hypothetical protein